MAFTVEDGTGIDGANSYSSTANSDTYHTDRNNTSWLQLTTPAKQAALIKATDYIDQRFTFIGTKESESQGLAWPRFNALDKDGYYRSSEVPEEVLKAVSEYALLASVESLYITPSYNTTGLDVKKTKDVVGPIETEIEYATDSSSGATQRTTVKELPEADSYLWKLTVSSNTIVRA